MNQTPERSPALAGELLREVARLYNRAQREVADCCGSTSTQCYLLMELGRSGAMSQTELGQRLSLEKSWVSRAVEGLVEQGLVLKVANPQDARSWLLSLSRAGEQRYAALNRTLDNHASHLLDCLSARERAAVEQSLTLLLHALQNHRDAAACCVAPAPSGPTRKQGVSPCR